ncbi:TorF family putative porin [Sphingomonas sp. S2-65]|uniref:TorF family putative porin n=1 Tax=Sphingomonas sp. S2-65 TaxID=2903960 RepID=UPI001F47B630|nr:TorF family putative porin [Sphingomonas sp. S2-65]UYY59093.1 TorF family putative porin [Sphingomonas sp. S2-65]
MKFLVTSTAAAVLFVCSAPGALAQETDPPGPITVSGSAALVSDYRFRGVSQSDEEIAVQAGFTVAHESGFYIGTWGSNLAGWGTFGGANVELDLIGGYKTDIGNGGTLDIGVTWYMYPGGADETDFAEPYVKLGGSLGPVSLTAGVAYAPKQEALGNYSATPYSRGQKEDNLYLWGDGSTGLPGTPVTLKAHIGYSDGNPGLGPNGTSVAPTGKYWDWMLGADVAVGPLTLGVAYVDTDISRSESAYLLPNFSSTKDGGSIADGQAVFSVSAAF